jgi:arabinoxylan arabinofuranohydrolase
LNPASFTKVHNVFFVFTEAKNVCFDSWQFTEFDPTGVVTVSTEAKASEKKVYDLSGRRLSEGSNYRGIVIEQYTDENGTKRVRKISAAVRKE